MTKTKFEVEIKSSPINSKILYTIGVYLCFVFVLCIFINAILLSVFARFKKLLFGSIQFPFVIHSNFAHK